MARNGLDELHVPAAVSFGRPTVFWSDGEPVASPPATARAVTTAATALNAVPEDSDGFVAQDGLDPLRWEVRPFDDVFLDITDLNLTHDESSSGVFQSLLREL